MTDLITGDPLGVIVWGVFALAAGMFPIGMMLGSPCSPCCDICSCASKFSGKRIVVNVTGPTQPGTDKQSAHGFAGLYLPGFDFSPRPADGGAFPSRIQYRTDADGRTFIPQGERCDYWVNRAHSVMTRTGSMRNADNTYDLVIGGSGSILYHELPFPLENIELGLARDYDVAAPLQHLNRCEFEGAAQFSGATVLVRATFQYVDNDQNCRLSGGFTAPSVFLRFPSYASVVTQTGFYDQPVDLHYAICSASSFGGGSRVLVNQGRCLLDDTLEVVSALSQVYYAPTICPESHPYVESFFWGYGVAPDRCLSTDSSVAPGLVSAGLWPPVFSLYGATAITGAPDWEGGFSPFFENRSAVSSSPLGSNQTYSWNYNLARGAWLYYTSDNAGEGSTSSLDGPACFSQTYLYPSRAVSAAVQIQDQ